MWCYVNETDDVLVSRTPKLGTALAKAGKDGLPYPVLDGTLILIDGSPPTGSAARLGPRPDSGPDPRCHPGTGDHRSTRAGRQA